MLAYIFIFFPSNTIKKQKRKNPLIDRQSDGDYQRKREMGEVEDDKEGLSGDGRRLDLG